MNNLNLRYFSSSRQFAIFHGLVVCLGAAIALGAIYFALQSPSPTSLAVGFRLWPATHDAPNLTAINCARPRTGIQSCVVHYIFRDAPNVTTHVSVPAGRFDNELTFNVNYHRVMAEPSADTRFLETIIVAKPTFDSDIDTTSYALDEVVEGVFPVLEAAVSATKSNPDLTASLAKQRIADTYPRR